MSRTLPRASGERQKRSGTSGVTSKIRVGRGRHREEVVGARATTEGYGGAMGSIVAEGRTVLGTGFVEIPGASSRPALLRVSRLRQIQERDIDDVAPE